MATKINPCKIPRTEADCERRFKDGIDMGCHAAIAMLVFTLVDNGFMNNEEVCAFNKRFMSTVECVGKGNLKIKDLEQIPYNEYDWKVDL